MGPLSRWAVRKPKTALLGWAVFFALVLVLGIRFGGEYNDSFELPDTESTTAQELLAETAAADAAGGGTARVVWSPETGSAIDEATIATMAPILEDVAAVPSIECVAAPWGERIGTDCAQPQAPDIAELPPDQAAVIEEAAAAAAEATSPVSPDGSVAFATATFGSDLNEVPAEDAVTVLDLVEEADAIEGITVGASGNALGFAEQEPPASEGIGVLVAIIILLLAFGSVIAAGLPIVVALIGLAGGLSLVSFAANFLDVATFGPTLAAMIGLGVGIDYALFVINRYRQSRMSGHEPDDAAIESVNTAGRAVLFAGSTVIIALMGLFVLGIGFFYGLAVGAAVTVFMVMLSALWLLPALISLLGTKTLGWRLPWARKDKTWHPEGGRWASYGHALQRRPIIPAVLALALVIFLALPTLSARLGFADDGGRPEDSPLRVGYDLLAEGFGPGVNGPFFVAVDLPEAGDAETTAAAITAFNETPGVASTLPTIEMLPLALQPTDTVTAIQVIGEYSPQAPETAELLDRLREQTIPPFEADTGAEAYVGGFTAVTADFTDVIIDALPLFLAVVIGLGFLALVLLFRSIVVPLTGAVTSLLSLGAALGITVAVFQWGWFADIVGVESTGPIFPFLPVMVFAILFGLSMDYQVFLVSRMQEEWINTQDNASAVRRGLAGSGRVVAIAAAIMSSVFLAFVPSPTQEIKLFGVALASAVLIDAFVVRLVLVPSVMSILGSANWWLPEPLRKVLPQIHIEGGSDEITDYVEPGTDEPAGAGAR
jgi:RND superfamily putative drug exporter